MWWEKWGDKTKRENWEQKRRESKVIKGGVRRVRKCGKKIERESWRKIEEWREKVEGECRENGENWVRKWNDKRKGKVEKVCWENRKSRMRKWRDYRFRKWCKNEEWESAERKCGEKMELKNAVRSEVREQRGKEERNWCNIRQEKEERKWSENIEKKVG